MIPTNQRTRRANDDVDARSLNDDYDEDDDKMDGLVGFCVQKKESKKERISRVRRKVGREGGVDGKKTKKRRVRRR